MSWSQPCTVYRACRSCPGSLLADASVFMAAAMSLAVFDFKKDVDAQGQTIEPKFEFVEGTLT